VIDQSATAVSHPPKAKRDSVVLGDLMGSAVVLQGRRTGGFGAEILIGL